MEDHAAGVLADLGLWIDGQGERQGLTERRF